uniref:SAP domain-containing protein n=1 Tax=Dunaliella tertiolecta TaxID=3047 RepID=A0A7S3QR11_DUNTE
MAGPVDPAALRAELAAMPTEELTKMLEQMEENVQGSREELIEHLAQAIEGDMLREQQEGAQPDVGTGGGRAPSLPMQGRELTEQDKAVLLQARRAAALEETPFMSRPALYTELKEIYEERGLPRPNYGSRNTLAQLLADVRAEAALEEELRQAATDPQVMDALVQEADELLASGEVPEGPMAPAEEEDYLEDDQKSQAATGINNSGILLTEENADPEVISSMPTLMVRRLKVSELRTALGVLGLSMEGNKYDMVERLTSHNVEVAANAKQSKVPQMQQFEAMDVRQLRAELQQRGLEVTGSRAALMERLADQLAPEGALADEAQLAEQMPAVYQLQPLSPEARLIQEDPPMTLTVLLGAPGGSLLDLDASLNAARCTVDCMYTGWPAPAFSSTAGGDASGGAAEDHAGVRVRLLHLKDDLSVTEISPASLHGVGAPELAAGAVAALEGGASFASLEDLAVGLTASGGKGQDALLPAVSTSGMTAPQRARLQQALSSVVLPVLGGPHSPAQATDLAGDKLRLRSKLKELGYPVMPAWQMLVSDLASLESWSSKFEAFVDKQGWHQEQQVYVIKPANGCSGRRITAAMGTADAAQAAQGLLQELAGLEGQSSEGPAVVIEPYKTQEALHFSVTVLEGPDGPLAFIPTEIESADVDTQIIKSEIAQREWLMMKEGMGPQMIQEHVSAMLASSTFADARLMAVSQRGLTPFTRMIRYHSPARLSRKMLHHVRHGAALLFLRLGLRGAARMDGWIDLMPDWQEAYDREDDGIPRLLADQDPGIMERVMDEVIKEDMAGPAPPLQDYYSLKSGKADLSKFSPQARLNVQSNGEGNVFFTDVNVVGLHSPELDPAGPMFQQAAELGISHAALLRNLVNIALRNASKQSKDEAGTALAMPPPIDPAELAAVMYAKPDDIDIWQAITEWREEKRMADINEEMEKAEGLRQAYHVVELVDDALADRSPDQLPFSSLALDWDTEFDSRPPDQATVEKEGPRTDEDAWREELEEKASIEELADMYPGLPTDDLIYVKMGHGPKGQAIDFEKLQRMLRERAQVGDEYVPVDALQACYIEEEEEEEEEIDAERLLQQGMSGEDVAAMVMAKERRQEVGALVEEGERTRVGEWGKVLTPTGFGPLSEPEIILSSQHRLDPKVGASVALDELKYHGSKNTQKVWVLCGGHHESATTSLRAGLNMALQLQQCADVHVELFLLTYGGSGRNEEAVRKALLKRRNEWLVTGLGEEDLTEGMALENLQNTEPLDTLPQNEFVWALPFSTALQHSADSANCVAERILHMATTAEHSLHTLEQHALEVQSEVQRELSQGGIEGVGGLWGGNPVAPPVPPRCLQLGEFGAQSVEAEAVVVPMVRGWMGSSGMLAQLLQDTGAVFAGCGPTAAMVCGDKQATMDVIEEMGEDSGVITLPTRLLMVEELLAAGSDMFACKKMFKGLREAMQSSGSYDEEGEEEEEELDEIYEGSLLAGAERIAAIQAETGEGFTPVILRPCDGADGVGLAVIATPEDLKAYCTALTKAAPFIPAGALSLPQPQLSLPTNTQLQPLREGQALLTHGPIPMPRFPPAAFLVQPYYTTDRIAVTPGAPPTILGDAGWVEVCIGLLGGVGSMEPLGLSLVAHHAPATPSAATSTNGEGQTSSSIDGSAVLAGGLEWGARVHLTPAPESLVQPEVIEAAMLRARGVADHMGLQGLVKMDAFMNREDGTLVMIECDATPNLNADSVLFQQALKNPSRPMAPAELLRALVNLGLAADEARVQNPDSLGEIGYELGSGAALVEEEAEEVMGEYEEEEGEEEAEEGELTEDVEGAADGLTEDDVRAAAAERGLVGRDEFGVEDDASMLNDLVASQGLGVPVPSTGDEQEVYLSSSGRTQRRSRGTTGEYVGGSMDDEDQYIDRMGESDEDPEFQSNWNMGGAWREV